MTLITHHKCTDEYFRKQLGDECYDKIKELTPNIDNKTVAILESVHVHGRVRGKVRVTLLIHGQCACDEEDSANVYSAVFCPKNKAGKYCVTLINDIAVEAEEKLAPVCAEVIANSS